MVRRFTDALNSLMNEGNLGLTESLEIISKNKRQGKRERAAAYLLEALKNGGLLSNAMKSCPHLNFGNTYVAFVSFAEKGGNMKETMGFLANREKRAAENKAKLLESGLYPLFVLFAAIFLSFFLSAYCGLENKRILIRYVIFLTVAVAGLLWLLKILTGEDRLYEAFLAVGFLSKAGINIGQAISCAVQITGVETRAGRAFVTAGERLAFGMGVEAAFNIEKSGLSDAFYYADRAGNKTDLFEKAADFLLKKDEKRRKICFAMLEPVCTGLAGIFVMLLMMNVFLPFMGSMTI